MLFILCRLLNIQRIRDAEQINTNYSNNIQFTLRLNEICFSNTYELVVHIPALSHLSLPTPAPTMNKSSGSYFALTALRRA